MRAESTANYVITIGIKKEASVTKRLFRQIETTLEVRSVKEQKRRCPLNVLIQHTLQLIVSTVRSTCTRARQPPVGCHLEAGR